MKNATINRGVLRKIAVALGELNQEVVYVGGAVVGLYINDPSADDVRPTKDVDISLAIATLGELENIREQLSQKGFKQSAEDTVICRFRFEDIKVDVMSTRAVGWAPANPWFAPGFKLKEEVMVEDQLIQILPLPYFLASKFSAFNDRGKNDPRTSHDFEDINYILDNRTDIVEQLLSAPEEVKSFLVKELALILQDERKQEAISANLYYETAEVRFNKIIDNIKSIVEVNQQ